jgi:hypothetical protein
MLLEPAHLVGRRNLWHWRARQDSDRRVATVDGSRSRIEGADDWEAATVRSA